jgi:integrase
MTEHKGGRARTGGLLWRHGKWYGRWTADVEGEAIQVVRSLETTSKPVAKRRLARAMAEGTPSQEDVERPETFTEAAARVLESQEKQGMATVKERRSRLERYALPSLGPVPVTEIKAQDVREVLESARDAGLGRQSLLHLLHDVSSVLGELWREETLPENVAKRVTVKDVLPHREQKKERAVLTDAELVRYLGWQHPEEQYRMAALERQVMACVARMLGGQRTSDLHAARWEDFALPEFTEARVRSEKTGKTRRLHVPEMLRPILADWWTRRGEPKTGLLFPTRRGDRAGQQRIGITHAKAFRRDLRRAFGLEVPERVRIMRSHGKPDTRIRWKPGRQPTERERTLLEGDANTLPVDFHSWRRAFSQALAEAGLNEQQAMALAGHESEEAHRRYLRARDRLRELPIAALPRLGVLAQPWPKLTSGSPLSQYATGDSNARPSAPEADALSS